MIRAFVALALPEDIRERLAMVQATLPVRRVVPQENLHVTLAFLGEVPESLLEDVHLALLALHAPAFELTLVGLGLFGGTKPRVVHAGVAECSALRHLQAKVDQAIRGAGAAPERRRFTPHVTLAYPRAGQTDPLRLERAVAEAARFRAGPFPVDSFGLFRSDLGRHGALHAEIASYPLQTSQNVPPAP